MDGKKIKALVQLTKQAYAFVLDRTNGKPVWPIEEKPVPQGNIPGEVYSPTQPVPTKPAPLELQQLTENDLIDFTKELRVQAQEIFKQYTAGPIFSPAPLDHEMIMLPGTTGAANWNGGGFDPDTGMLYVPSKQGMSVTGLAAPGPDRKANLRYIQVPPKTPNMRGSVPLLKPPYSRLTAVNMNTGDHVWMTPAGNGDRIRNLPELPP